MSKKPKKNKFTLSEDDKQAIFVACVGLVLTVIVAIATIFM